MYYIAVCDDEKNCIDEVTRAVREYYDNTDVTIDTYCCGSDILKSSRINEYDIMLLDIEMEHGSGIELKNELENYSGKAFIIFVTSHSEYVMDAIGRNVCGYICKPIDKGVLYKKLGQITGFLEQEHSIMVVDIFGVCNVIRLIDIIHIDVNNVYTDIYLANGTDICVRKSLLEWEKELDSSMFIRINRKNIVNMGRMCQCGKEARMDNGTVLAVARERRSDVREHWMEYQRRRVRII